jgi:molecular chaperone GrpE
VNRDNENGKSIVDSAEADPRTEEEPAPEPTEDEVDSAEISDVTSQLEAIVAERDRLAGEKQELEDRLLRRQAEFENFRRRVEREKQEFAAYAAMDTVGALLPILDDFERALKAVPEELGTDNEYVRGVEMIYQRLIEALKKAGLEPIDSVGQPFDPNVHHAVDRVPTEEADDHSVLEEWQRGYNFKGKLLREAMVKVAVKPSSDE